MSARHTCKIQGGVGAGGEEGASAFAALIRKAFAVCINVALNISFDLF